MKYPSLDVHNCPRAHMQPINYFPTYIASAKARQDSPSSLQLILLHFASTLLFFIPNVLLLNSWVDIILLITYIDFNAKAFSVVTHLIYYDKRHRLTLKK